MNGLLGQLRKLQHQGSITDLDFHFTRFIAEQARQPSPELLLGACVASHWTGNGNVCVNLYAIAEQTLFEIESQEAIVTPAAKPWIKALRRSRVVGQPGQFRPLILDGRGRLYLYRYWDYERRLLDNLLARADVEAQTIDGVRLREDLTLLFPESAAGKPLDWQKIAALTALLKPFCIISGGPGTGKTSTVVRILALLLGQYKNVPRIALAAPTGKAAARMQEAIASALQGLNLTAEVAEAIPNQAFTIHRLLGPRAGSVSFDYNAGNPLPIDILIIDEASMIDLALMTKLVEALPRQARLLLLGDKDQLASVEAGAVLGDICGDAGAFSAPFRARLQELVGTSIALPEPSNPSPLGDAIVLLQHSYRFGPDSGIGQVARAVNAGDPESAQATLDNKEVDDARWHELEAERTLISVLEETIVRGYEGYIDALRSAAPLDVIFERFNRFRVLCALRRGPVGLEEINAIVERILHLGRHLRVRPPWYVGRPVIITRNDHNLGLYNGDIGIALADDKRGLRIYFQTGDGVYRDLPGSRLPEHETVFAMTIHKSQGSEFDHVMLLLPPEANRVLSRELIYTGVTRARKRIDLYGNRRVFASAIARRLQRSSGLRDGLWQ